MRRPAPQLSLIVLVALFPNALCKAASLLIDDFSSGPFSLIGQYGASLDDKDIQVGTMLGGDRYTALTSSSRQTGVTSILVTGGSEFSFNANTGPPGLLGNQGIFYAVYGVPLASRDFTSYSGFMLSIPSASGAGIVEVRLGAASFSVPIDHAGSIFVPIEGSGVSSSLLASVNQIRLQFTAVSSDFSVSVDRFSAVPEPSTFMLISAGMGLYFRRNRRNFDLLTALFKFIFIFLSIASVGAHQISTKKKVSETIMKANYENSDTARKSSLLPSVVCFSVAIPLGLISVLMTLMMLLANMNINFSSSPQLGMFLAGWSFVGSGFIATCRLLRKPSFQSLWYLVVPVTCMAVVQWLGKFPENRHLMH